MNTRIVLANRPAEGPIPANTFKQEQQAIPRKEDLKDGEVVVRVMWLSLVRSLASLQGIRITDESILISSSRHRILPCEDGLEMLEVGKFFFERRVYLLTNGP